MRKTRFGDKVKVHYTAKFENGKIFDTTSDREPLEFTIGRDQVLPGLEKAVHGMKPGEAKTTKIPAKEAFGQNRDELVVDVDRARFPDEIDPKIGEHLALPHKQHQKLLVRVADVSEDKITLDANHPLAGEDLKFDIKLVDVN